MMCKVPKREGEESIDNQILSMLLITFFDDEHNDWSRWNHNKRGVRQPGFSSQPPVRCQITRGTKQITT